MRVGSAKEWLYDRAEGWTVLLRFCSCHSGEENELRCSAAARSLWLRLHSIHLIVAPLDHDSWRRYPAYSPILVVITFSRYSSIALQAKFFCSAPKFKCVDHSDFIKWRSSRWEFPSDIPSFSSCSLRIKTQRKLLEKWILCHPRDGNPSEVTEVQEPSPQTFEEKIIDILRACRGSRKLVILIVAVALLLDNMLLTSVGESISVLYSFQK